MTEKLPPKWTGPLVGKMHNEEITYEELGAELGVSKAYIGMILNGARNPEGARERLEAAVDAIVRRRNGEEAAR